MQAQCKEISYHLTNNCELQKGSFTINWSCDDQYWDLQNVLGNITFLPSNVSYPIACPLFRREAKNGSWDIDFRIEDTLKTLIRLSFNLQEQADGFSLKSNDKSYLFDNPLSFSCIMEKQSVCEGEFLCNIQKRNEDFYHLLDDLDLFSIDEKDRKPFQGTCKLFYSQPKGFSFFFGDIAYDGRKLAPIDLVAGKEKEGWKIDIRSFFSMKGFCDIVWNKIFTFVELFNLG